VRGPFTEIEEKDRDKEIVWHHRQRVGGAKKIELKCKKGFWISKGHEQRKENKIDHNPISWGGRET